MKEKYDVVIVGTGVAGCFAALHLSENMDVLMITKGDLEESDSFLAQGGICVQKDDDDYDSFYEDTMRAGHCDTREKARILPIEFSFTRISREKKSPASFLIR